LVAAGDVGVDCCVEVVGELLVCVFDCCVDVDGGGWSETETTGVLTVGTGIWSAGVPAGAVTVTGTVSPVARVTYTVRSSAPAGRIVLPKPAANSPATTNPIRSLRVCMKCGFSLRRSAPRNARERPGLTLAWRSEPERRNLRGCLEECKREAMEWKRHC